MGVDVDELEVRVASETSDRLAEQADGPMRVKKKNKGKKKSGDRQRADRSRRK